MIQCKDCELCEIAADGRKTFKCDPFSTIKEPECLAKMQLLRMEMLLASFRTMLGWYDKMGPMQKKIFKYVQRELDDIDEADKWKTDENNEEDDFPEPQDDYI